MMSRQSVLVVEDEEDIMEVIRFNLEKGGYEVHQAFSGEKALQVIENNLPSLDSEGCFRSLVRLFHH